MDRTRPKTSETTPERGSVPPRPREPEPGEQGSEPVRAGEVFPDVFETLERAARRRAADAG